METSGWALWVSTMWTHELTGPEFRLGGAGLAVPSAHLPSKVLERLNKRDTDLVRSKQTCPQCKTKGEGFRGIFLPGIIHRLRSLRVIFPRKSWRGTNLMRKEGSIYGMRKQK